MTSQLMSQTLRMGVVTGSGHNCKRIFQYLATDMWFDNSKWYNVCVGLTIFQAIVKSTSPLMVIWHQLSMPSDMSMFLSS